MKEPKDKRTKEWKEWNASQNKPEGLGDVIETIAEKTGVKALVEMFTPEGKDCGCDKRKAKLNKLFPIRRKPVRCLNKKQYDAYTDYKRTRSLKTWHSHEIDMLLELYAHIFAVAYNKKDLCKNCSGSAKILLRISDELDKVHASYKAE